MIPLVLEAAKLRVLLVVLPLHKEAFKAQEEVEVVILEPLVVVASNAEIVVLQLV